MNNLKLKSSVRFIFYPKSWIKNKITGEVRWFEAIGRNAEDAAAAHWAFFNSHDKIENLGSSFFETKTFNSMDNTQMNQQRKEYLLKVSIKINQNTGVKEDLYNNITYEYLCSFFLGTPFGNNSSKGSELPGVIWGYGGGGVAVEKKFVKGLVSFSSFNLFDSFMSSQDIEMGSDKNSNDRAKAVNDFNSRTKNYIDNEVLLNIKLHKF